jgi:outer membrane protein TolC
LLEFLTGTPVTGIKETGTVFPSLSDQEYYTAASGSRFDVLALSDAWEVSKRQVDISRGGLLPTVTVEGNYFLMRNTAPQDSSWSSLLSVNFPLFEGTEIYGEITQSKLQSHEKLLELQRGVRLSRFDVRDAYIRTAAEIARCKALKLAMEASDENYYLQRQDYSLNLVSNLDVLSALQLRNQARQSYVQSFYEAKRLYEALLIAAGKVTFNE